MEPSNREGFVQWLTSVRRDLHAHPELSFKEYRTSERILDILGDLGWKANAFAGTTGAVGLLLT